MSGVGVIIERDDATPFLDRITSEAQSQGLMLVMARGVGIVIKDHLVALNAQRHRHGRNYYAQAARSVTARAAGSFAIASVTQVGFRQRLYGGRITAGQSGSGKRFLTIPATPEAYGMRAGEFNDLRLGRALNDQGRIQWCLIRRASSGISISRRKQKDGSYKTTARPNQMNASGGEVMFWLVHSVLQKADPTVLPKKAEMLDAATAAGRRRLFRKLDRPGQGEPNS